MPFFRILNSRLCLLAVLLVGALHPATADGAEGRCQANDPCPHADGGKEDDGSALLQLSRQPSPVHGEVVNTSLSDLKLWFGYTRESLKCFQTGDLKALLAEHGGDAGEDQLRSSDLVVLLEAQRRPSAAEVEKLGELIDFEMEPCHPQQEPGLDAQASAYLGDKMELVQLNLLSEEDPKRVEETLLNVWYNTEALQLGRGLAYKNNFPGGPSGTCQDNEAAALTGSMEVSADSPFHMCADARRKGWTHYRSSEGTLAISFLPVAGGEPFAVLGLSLAATGTGEGQEEMLSRAKFDIHSKLGVAHHRIFTIGEGASALGAGAADSEHFSDDFAGRQEHLFSFTEPLASVVTMDGHDVRKTQLLQEQTSSVTWLRFQHSKRMGLA